MRVTCFLQISQSAAVWNDEFITVHTDLYTHLLIIMFFCWEFPYHYFESQRKTHASHRYKVEKITKVNKTQNNTTQRHPACGACLQTLRKQAKCTSLRKIPHFSRCVKQQKVYNWFGEIYVLLRKRKNIVCFSVTHTPLINPVCSVLVKVSTNRYFFVHPLVVQWPFFS